MDGILWCILKHNYSGAWPDLIMVIPENESLYVLLGNTGRRHRFVYGEAIVTIVSFLAVFG